MNSSEVKEITRASSVHEASGHPSLELTDFFASDLMSDVLTVDKENFGLITSLTSDQVMRTSDIVGVDLVIIVNGKTPQDRLINLAKELDISLYTTELSTFQVCSALGKALEQGL